MDPITLILIGLIVLFIIEFYRLETKISRVASFYSDLDYMKKFIDSLRSDFNNIESNYGSIKKYIRVVKSNSELLLNLKQKLINIEQNLKKYNQELNILSKNYKTNSNDITQIEKKLVDLDNKNIQLNTLLKRLDVLDQTLSDLNARYITLSDDFKTVQTDIDSLFDKYNTVSFVLDSYQDFKKDMLKEVSSVKALSRKLDVKMAKFDVLSTTVEKQGKSIEQLQHILNTFNVSKTNLLEMFSKNREHIKELQKLVKSLRAPVVYKDMKQIKTDVINIRKSISTLDYELSLLRAKLFTLSTKYESLISPTDLEEAFFGERIKEAKERIERIEKLIKSIKSSLKRN